MVDEICGGCLYLGVLVIKLCCRAGHSLFGYYFKVSTKVAVTEMTIFCFA